MIITIKWLLWSWPYNDNTIRYTQAFAHYYISYYHPPYSITFSSCITSPEFLNVWLSSHVLSNIFNCRRYPAKHHVQYRTSAKHAISALEYLWKIGLLSFLFFKAKKCVLFLTGRYRFTFLNWTLICINIFCELFKLLAFTFFV